MTSGAAVEARWGPKCGNTSSTTAAGGATRKAHCGLGWERGPARKRQDPDLCRSLRCFPWQNVTKQ